MNLMDLKQEASLELEHQTEQKLKPGQIRLCTLDLQADFQRLNGMTDLLSGDELARAGKFKFARDTRRYIVARAGLRQALAGVLEEAPEALRFEYSKSGKPALCQESEGPRLCFNISHSGDLALLALAWDLDLGVDLELERQETGFTDMAQLVFNAPEMEWLDSQITLSKSQAFFRIWTLKEALLKATGEGLGSALRSYCIIPGNEGGAQVMSYESRVIFPDWNLKSFIPRPGFRAGLAYRSRKSIELQMDYGTSFAYSY